MYSIDIVSQCDHNKDPPTGCCTLRGVLLIRVFDTLCSRSFLTAFSWNRKSMTQWRTTLDYLELKRPESQIPPGDLGVTILHVIEPLHSARVMAASKLAGRWQRTHLEVSAVSPTMNCFVTTSSTMQASLSAGVGCSHRHHVTEPPSIGERLALQTHLFLLETPAIVLWLKAQMFHYRLANGRHPQSCSTLRDTFGNTVTGIRTHAHGVARWQVIY